jgi:hypothetical protein
MKSFKLLIALFLTAIQAQSQDSTNVTGLFEGKVTYIHQILNPNKGLISDDEFYRDMPNGGKSIVTLFIRGNQYKWEHADRIEFFNPKLQQLAVVSKRAEDSVYVTPASFVEEKVEKIVKSSLTKKLLGYDLVAQEIHTKWDTKTFFYSPLALKTNPSFWKNHRYNHLAEMTSLGKSFPMIIHQQSLLGNWIMAASKIEAIKLEDSIFDIPENK